MTHVTVVGTCLGEAGDGGGGVRVVLSGDGAGRNCLYNHLFTILSGVRRSTGKVDDVHRECVGTTDTAPTSIFTAVLGLSSRRVRGLAGRNGGVFFRGVGRRVVSGVPTSNFPTRLSLRSRNEFFVKCCRRERRFFAGGRRRGGSWGVGIGGVCCN